MANPTSDLAHFAVATRLADIPATVGALGRFAITDALGTVLCGLTEDSVIRLRDLAHTEYRTGKARVLGTGLRLAAPGAALANGAAAHALDFDNISLTVSGFIASPVLFALLALAEEEGGVSGARVLEAFIVGWEAEAAIARALGVDHYARGWHSTATLGHFGAAIGAAKLLGLDAMQMRHAIGIVAAEASGLRTMIGNMLNPFHVGKAARNGVTAVRLAQAGFTGHPDVLETPWGFCRAFNGEGNYDLAAITSGLGSRWDLEDPGLVIKVHPCCGLIHSALDGVLDLAAEHDLDWRQVAAAHIDVHELVPKTMRFDDPQTGYEAKFSAPFCIASALHERSVKLAHFTDARTRDAELRGLMARVSMAVHPELRGYETFLEREFTDVTLRLNDGRSLQRRIWRIANRGSRGRRLNEAELAEKFTDCAAGWRDPAAALRALEKLHRLEELADIEEVTSCLA